MKTPTVNGRRLSSRKLTLTFLSIIMTMSILFSSVFYLTSAHELDKRPSGDIGTTQLKDPDHELDEWIGRRSDDGKVALGQHLIALNFIALMLGALVSYLLARTALRPIERALNEQDRFTEDASHELRTPITSALLGNEIALKNPSLTLEDAKSIIANNVSDMQELKKLSDELLDQTPAGHLQEIPRKVSLEKLITDAMPTIKKLAEDKKINVIYNAATAVVTTYPKTVSKILTTLLDNSIKYSPEGTTVTITGSVQAHDVSIVVKDEGIGISKSDQAHVFDRFYRSDASRSEHDGYGLGLAIVKDLVAQIKGSIRVTSTINEGSKFTVRLPRD